MAPKLGNSIAADDQSKLHELNEKLNGISSLKSFQTIEKAALELDALFSNDDFADKNTKPGLEKAKLALQKMIDLKAASASNASNPNPNYMQVIKKDMDHAQMRLDNLAMLSDKKNFDMDDVSGVALDTIFTKTTSTLQRFGVELFTTDIELNAKAIALDPSYGDSVLLEAGKVFSGTYE